MRAGCALGLAAFAWVMGVTAGTAHALTCSVNSVNYFPLNQQNVPTNTLLWGYSSSARLLGPAGEVVPTEERALVVGGWMSTRWTIPVLVPNSALQPGARYTIEIDSESDDPVEPIEFVTADGPASTPPAPPALIASEPHAGTTWVGFTPVRWTNLRFQDISGHGLILIGDPGASSENDPLSSVTSLEDLLIDGPASEAAFAEAPMVQWLSETDDLAVGIADCTLWPDGAPDTLTGRFATLDLAGNFSGWTEVPVQLPSAAEAQAAADEQAELNAQVAAEDARIRAENLAKLDAANQAHGCTLQPSRPRKPNALAALAALAFALIARTRRGQRNARG